MTFKSQSDGLATPKERQGIVPPTIVNKMHKDMILQYLQDYEVSVHENLDVTDVASRTYFRDLHYLLVFLKTGNK